MPGRSSLIWRGVTELVRSNPAHAYRPVQNRLPPTAADAGCRRGLRRAAECVARGATGGWNDPVPRRAAARRLRSPSRRFSKAAAIPLRTAATSRPELGLQRSSLPVPEVGPRAHSINRKWSLAVIYAEPVGQLNGSASGVAAARLARSLRPCVEKFTFARRPRNIHSHVVMAPHGGLP